MTDTILTALPALPPGVWARRARDALPFPFGDPDARLFARARHGLWHGVRALGLEPGDEVLVPAFHHGSEVEALLRAGLSCRFYEVDPRLEPDARALADLVGPRTRALQIVHYLGWPQDSGRWRAWCDARGLLLFEDCAHAWLAETGAAPAGAAGDLAIFCLYKSLGLPDGAVLRARAPSAGSAGRRPVAAVGMALEHAVWLASRSDALGRVAGAVRRRPRRYDPLADFALGAPGPASVAAVAAVRRADLAAVAPRRRAHFAAITGELPDLVPSALAQPPPGACPLVAPVAVADKPGLVRQLRRAGVRALDLWSVPHPALPAREFPRSAALRGQLVGLPVHQELRPADLERIVAAVRRARPRPAVPWAS